MAGIEDGGFERVIFEELFSQYGISPAQRMAGITVEFAGQDRRHIVINGVLLKPGLDFVFHQAVGVETIRLEGVLIKRADEHEHPVASGL